MSDESGYIVFYRSSNAECSASDSEYFLNQKINYFEDLEDAFEHIMTFVNAFNYLMEFANKELCFNILKNEDEVNDCLESDGFVIVCETTNKTIQAIIKKVY